MVVVMEWNPIEIRKSEAGEGVEAKLAGGYMINGDSGCFITFTGWGPDEKSARENLKIAIAQAKAESIPEG